MYRNSENEFSCQLLTLEEKYEFFFFTYDHYELPWKCT